METERTFKCAMCHETFIKGWTDDDAMKEYEQNYGQHMGEEYDTVCDACHAAIMAWRGNSKEGLQ